MSYRRSVIWGWTFFFLLGNGIFLYARNILIDDIQIFIRNVYLFVQ